MSMSKLFFGQVAVGMNLVAEDQVNECLDIQRRLREMGIEKTLGAVMHDKKYLSLVEIKQVLRNMASATDLNVIAGYEILCKLGRGGMGNVYKARHAENKTTVAMKILPPELATDAEYLSRFNREARAATQINHPGIVQAIDIGSSYGFHYFVMEYVDGVNAREMLTHHGRVPEAAALDVVAQIAEALSHAWALNIIHRDIKPTNILITSDGTAKLCDFGLAKSVDDKHEVTQVGIIMGTPYYLSPEQARGDQLDCRTDTYGLGVTLYQLLTGQVPFTGSSTATILYKHIFQDVPDPRLLTPELSDGTVQLIHRMLAKRPPARQQSPKALVDEVRNIQATLGPPPGQTLLGQLQKQVSKTLHEEDESHVVLTDEDKAVAQLLATQNTDTGGDSQEQLAHAQPIRPLDEKQADSEAPPALGAPQVVDSEGSEDVEAEKSTAHDHIVTSTARWKRLSLILSCVFALGFIGPLALLAHTLLADVETPDLGEALDARTAIAPAPIKPEVREAVALSNSLAAKGHYAEALLALVRVDVHTTLPSADLQLVIEARDSALASALQRFDELQAQLAEGVAIDDELRVLNLPAIADAIDFHVRWLRAQSPDNTR